MKKKLNANSFCNITSASCLFFFLKMRKADLRPARICEKNSREWDPGPNLSELYSTIYCQCEFKQVTKYTYFLIFLPVKCEKGICPYSGLCEDERRFHNRVPKALLSGYQVLHITFLCSDSCAGENAKCL